MPKANRASKSSISNLQSTPLKSFSPSLSEAEFEEMLNSLDLDESGRITFDECKLIYIRNEWSKIGIHTMWRLYEKSSNLTSHWKKDILCVQEELCVNGKAMAVILAKWSWSDHQMDPNNGQSQDEYGNGLKKTLEYLDLKPELFDLNIGLLDSSKVVSWKHMQHLGCKWWGTRKYPVITKVPSSLLTSKFCPTPTGIAGDDTIYRTIIPNKVLIVWDKEPQIVWTEGWVVTKRLGWVNIIQTKKQFENSSLYQTHTHGIEDQEEARLSILGTFIPLAER